MLFSEALQEMLKGNFVTRETYEKTTGEYYVLLPGMQFVWKIVTQPNPAAGNWLPLVDDLTASDWVVVDKGVVNVVKEALEKAAA